MKADAVVVSIIRRASSGSEPAEVLADDGRLYWMKPIGNPHGATSLLAERVVGVVGEWLSAPVAPSRLLDLSTVLAGRMQFSDMTKATPGLAHGSQVVTSQPLELDTLTHGGKDDNAHRGALYVALWELCAGEDQQFLYALDESHSVWSIDHGMWIGGQGQWSPDALSSGPKYSPHWSGTIRGLSKTSCLGAADRLEQLDQSTALALASSVPLEWGFTRTDLAHIADWLLERAPKVASRMRAYSSGAAKA